MTRVALYARYSSDHRSFASIQDQFQVCREHADRERWEVAATYQDAAISGARVILRPGVQTLLQDALGGRFDVVLAEALDWVSRDQADVATLFKHLRFAGVQIVTLAEGEISELHVGLKGTAAPGAGQSCSWCKTAEASPHATPWTCSMAVFIRCEPILGAKHPLLGLRLDESVRQNRRSCEARRCAVDGIRRPQSTLR